MSYINIFTCRLHNMETTMLSLATLPRAPPAALYNPLEHGHNLTDNQVVRGSEVELKVY